MLRRLFTGLSVISLLLCIAMAAAWFWSYQRYDSPTFSRANGLFLQLTSWHGDVVLDYFKNWPDDCTGYYTSSPSHGDNIGPLFFDSPTNNTRWEKFGFSFSTGDSVVQMAGGKTICFLHDEPEIDLQARANSWRVVDGFEITVPDSFVCGILAIVPAIMAYRWRELRRRRLMRLCLNCGYDLRATPDHCPECGAMPGETH